MQFSKWHGAGNDFVIVNGFKEKVAGLDLAAAGRLVCDRHFGVGADGLVFVLPSDSADFRMQIINSDGSEAEMCGNATRCVARYVYEQGLTDKTKVTLETLAGPIRPELVFADGKVSGVRVDMGKPRFKRGEIPMSGPAGDGAVNVPVTVDGRTYYGIGVNMGNPHFVIFLDEDVRKVELPVTGPKIETDALFPRKTNVEFANVLSRGELRMRVWERGAGVTLACGTGTCATVVAGALSGRCDRTALVHLDGGDLTIEWAEDDRVFMTGPAVEVFRGQFLLKI
jgi:diaminopimelate epimerase